MINDVELLRIVAALGGEAYTNSIMRSVERFVGREVGVGWVHMRINRLKSLGFLTRDKARLTANGSREKAIVRLTPKGEEVCAAPAGEAFARYNTSLAAAPARRL